MEVLGTGVETDIRFDRDDSDDDATAGDSPGLIVRESRLELEPSACTAPEDNEAANRGSDDDDDSEAFEPDRTGCRCSGKARTRLRDESLALARSESLAVCRLDCSVESVVSKSRKPRNTYCIRSSE